MPLLALIHKSPNFAEQPKEQRAKQGQRTKHPHRQTPTFEASIIPGEQPSTPLERSTTMKLGKDVEDRWSGGKTPPHHPHQSYILENGEG
ncbi:hypothetical protein TSUD_237800 [Trifolium subterraneum]|uniref:Uncharacterized protein n=1 Tax=Trifolium subterraneum TaxID=3900 RepID=A0A2Z6LWD7_TRISU|nr:hypothetical protein TSUD_237800 [Trifolium subterraneum]